MAAAGWDDTLNRISDWDPGWWPVLAARAQREQAFTPARVLMLSVAYGSAGAALALILASILFGPQPLANLLGAFPFMYVTCYAGYWWTFARAWNRRAERLARGTRDAAPVRSP